jgi:hypothetical protein
MGTVSIGRAACAKSRWSSITLVRAVRGDEQRVISEQRRDLLLVVGEILVERRAQPGSTATASGLKNRSA